MSSEQFASMLCTMGNGIKFYFSSIHVVASINAHAHLIHTLLTQESFEWLYKHSQQKTITKHGSTALGSLIVKYSSFVSSPLPTDACSSLSKY